MRTTYQVRFRMLATSSAALCLIACTCAACLIVAFLHPVEFYGAIPAIRGTTSVLLAPFLYAIAVIWIEPRIPIEKTWTEKDDDGEMPIVFIIFGTLLGLAVVAIVVALFVVMAVGLWHINLAHFTAALTGEYAGYAQEVTESVVFLQVTGGFAIALALNGAFRAARYLAVHEKLVGPRRERVSTIPSEA